MENEENTVIQDEEKMEKEVVLEEAPAEEVVEESQSEETTITPEDELAKVKAEAAKYRRLFEKTQAKPKVVAKAPTQAPQPASLLSVEETVLLANGMSEELLGELKAVAKARNIPSLIKAQADSIFVAVKDKFEKEQKSKDASLGASRSSGSVKAKKDFTTPGLSREDHKKMVLDALQ